MFKNLCGYRKTLELPKEKCSEPIENKEYDYYRIGLTNDGNTTLTILDHEISRVSLTIQLNSASVRRLIRMLESTLPMDEE
jgi:hypothetical protein